MASQKTTDLMPTALRALLLRTLSSPYQMKASRFIGSAGTIGPLFLFRIAQPTEVGKLSVVKGTAKCKDPRRILPGAIYMVDGMRMVLQGRHGKTLDKGTRRLILAQRPAGCPAVAVFFSAGVKHCLERVQEVSPSTLLQMAGTMEFPEYEEGFDAIYVTGAEPNRVIK